MRFFLIDLGHSWRLLRRQPGLTLAAVTALAMGIGFTTTMFSIVHGGTRPLPFDQPDQIVAIRESNHGSTTSGPDVRPYTVREWRRALTSFQGIAAFRSDSVNVSGGRTPERVPAAAVTPDTFSLLGAAVARGRAFNAADAKVGAPPVAIISDAVWRSRFGRDEAAVGGTIRLNGVPHTVIGIMAPGFGFPINARLWTPLHLDGNAAPGDGDPVQVFGRLRDGVTIDRAQRELRVVMTRLAASLPAAYEGHAAAIIGFTELETPRQLALGLQVLVLVVSLAFLVACANVANLLLARAAARSHDTAMRTALGASRRRLVAEQLAEATGLALVACALGLAMASIGLRFFAAASAGILQAFWVDFRIDAGVVAFATTLGLLSALAAGLVPALRATSAGLNALLTRQTSSLPGFRIGRLGRVLVVVQLALACGLLVLTATFVRASAALRAVDLVFPAKQILATGLSVPRDIVSDPARRHRLIGALHDQLDATPGLGPTAFVSTLPGRGAGAWSFSFADQADSGISRHTGVVMVTPEFFALAGASARRGRLLSWQDDERAAPVAVVNESFVRRFAADRDAVGRRIRIGSERAFTVVGVVPDLRMQDPEDEDGSGIYLSMLQARPFAVRTMTATAGAPLAALPAFRAAVGLVDPDLPVIEPMSLYDAIYADKRVLDAVASLFLAFGCGTVFLALIGMFALLSFTVTTRRSEFGLRMALGATAGDIVRIVLRRGAAELAWGLALGLGVAFATSRTVAATLQNTPPAGPGVFVAIAVTVVLGASLALWRPVRRAVTLSPFVALREP